MEVGLAAIHENQWIRLAIVARKVHLLEFQWPIIVVCAKPQLAARRGRAIRGDGLDCLRIRFNGGLQNLHSFGEGIEGGL